VWHPKNIGLYEGALHNFCPQVLRTIVKPLDRSKLKIGLRAWACLWLELTLDRLWLHHCVCLGPHLYDIWEIRRIQTSKHDSGAARGEGGSFPPYRWTSKNYTICVCFHCHGTSSYHTANINSLCTAVNVSASGGLRTLDPLSVLFCDGTSRYGVPENLTTG